MIRRPLIGAVLAVAALGLASCGKPGDPPPAGALPSELTFSILSAENQQSMEPLWKPLLDDLSAAIGVKVKPYFATNYTSLVEAMRFKQVQMGWFSASPALSAVKRADGEVHRRQQAILHQVEVVLVRVPILAALLVQRVVEQRERHARLGEPTREDCLLAPEMVAVTLALAQRFTAEVEGSARHAAREHLERVPVILVETAHGGRRRLTAESGE